MSCSLACSLMECGMWKAVIRSVLHHPTGQKGRGDTGDLWIIYQRWRLSHNKKNNVALAQMTFSHHHVLIAQCHEDPPPLLSYLAALTSSHAIKYEPDNSNLEQIQMPCVGNRIKWLQIRFFLFLNIKQLRYLSSLIVVFNWKRQNQSRGDTEQRLTLQSHAC